jgi:hypothetical protein
MVAQIHCVAIRPAAMSMHPLSMGWSLARQSARVLTLSLLPLLLPLWLLVAVLAAPASAATSEVATTARSYLCGGEPLEAELLAGPVDAVGIPNTLAGTLPGASVVLRWQGQQLPLPRTNNAGVPSYSDGKWFWRQDDPGHARLLLRRPGGDRQEFACEAVG